MVDSQLFLHSQLAPRRENMLSRIQKSLLRPHCVPRKKTTLFHILKVMAI